MTAAAVIPQHGGRHFQSRPLGLRRAVIGSALAHAVVIGAIVIAECSLNTPNAKPKNIVFIPAAPLGQLPRGSVVGIGEALRGKNPTASAVGPTPPNISAAPRSQPTPAPTRLTPTIPSNQTTSRPSRAPTAPTTQAQRAPTSNPAPNTTAATAPTPPTPHSNLANIRNQLLQGMQNRAPAGIPHGATTGTGVGARGTPAGGGAGGARAGDPDGSSVGILGGSGAGTPFWDYHLHIHDVLYAAWQQPSQFADPLRPPTARVRLRIGKDGSLWEAKLAQSSGIREVDESALNAARGARLNPPPSTMLGGKDFVEITVAFKLGGQG
jgi:TonB family protein